MSTTLRPAGDSPSLEVANPVNGRRTSAAFTDDEPAASRFNNAAASTLDIAPPADGHGGADPGTRTPTEVAASDGGIEPFEIENPMHSRHGTPASIREEDTKAGREEEEEEDGRDVEEETDTFPSTDGLGSSSSATAERRVRSRSSAIKVGSAIVDNVWNADDGNWWTWNRKSGILLIVLNVMLLLQLALIATVHASSLLTQHGAFPAPAAAILQNTTFTVYKDIELLRLYNRSLRLCKNDSFYHEFEVAGNNSLKGSIRTILDELEEILFMAQACQGWDVVRQDLEVGESLIVPLIAFLALIGLYAVHTIALTICCWRRVLRKQMKRIRGIGSRTLGSKRPIFIRAYGWLVAWAMRAGSPHYALWLWRGEVFEQILQWIAFTLYARAGIQREMLVAFASVLLLNAFSVTFLSLKKERLQLEVPFFIDTFSDYFYVIFPIAAVFVYGQGIEKKIIDQCTLINGRLALCDDGEYLENLLTVINLYRKGFIEIVKEAVVSGGGPGTIAFKFITLVLPLFSAAKRLRSFQRYYFRLRIRERAAAKASACSTTTEKKHDAHASALQLKKRAMASSAFHGGARALDPHRRERGLGLDTRPAVDQQPKPLPRWLALMHVAVVACLFITSMIDLFVTQIDCNMVYGKYDYESDTEPFAYLGTPAGMSANDTQSIELRMEMMCISPGTPVLWDRLSIELKTCDCQAMIIACARSDDVFELHTSRPQLPSDVELRLSKEYATVLEPYSASPYLTSLLVWQCPGIGNTTLKTLERFLRFPVARVEELSIQKSNLRDLPAFFGKMRALASLDLTSNLIGVYDAEANQFDGNKSLAFEHWDSDGQVPPLQQVALDLNLLGNKIPAWVLQLGRTLRILTLAKDSNMIDMNSPEGGLQSLPAAFRQLSGLQLLNLGYNKIRDISALGNLTELVRLDVPGNMLNLIPRSLGRLQKLVTLTMDSQEPDYTEVLFGRKLFDVRNLILLNQSLRQLHFGGAYFDDVWEPAVSSVLGELTSLVNLEMSHTAVETIEPLGRLTSLRNLEVSACDVGGAVPQSLKSLVNLRSLNLQDNHFTDIGAVAEIKPRPYFCALGMNEVLSTRLIPNATRSRRCSYCVEKVLRALEGASPVPPLGSSCTMLLKASRNQSVAAHVSLTSLAGTGCGEFRPDQCMSIINFLCELTPADFQRTAVAGLNEILVDLNWDPLGLFQRGNNCQCTANSESNIPGCKAFETAHDKAVSKKPVDQKKADNAKAGCQKNLEECTWRCNTDTVPYKESCACQARRCESCNDIGFEAKCASSTSYSQCRDHEPDGEATHSTPCEWKCLKSIPIEGNTSLKHCSCATTANVDFKTDHCQPAGVPDFEEYQCTANERGELCTWACRERGRNCHCRPNRLSDSSTIASLKEICSTELMLLDDTSCAASPYCDWVCESEENYPCRVGEGTCTAEVTKAYHALNSTTGARSLYKSVANKTFCIVGGAADSGTVTDSCWWAGSPSYPANNVECVADSDGTRRRYCEEKRQGDTILAYESCVLENEPCPCGSNAVPCAFPSRFIQDPADPTNVAEIPINAAEIDCILGTECPLRFSSADCVCPTQLSTDPNKDDKCFVPTGATIASCTRGQGNGLSQCSPPTQKYCPRRVDPSGAERGPQACVAPGQACPCIDNAISCLPTKAFVLDEATGAIAEVPVAADDAQCELTTTCPIFGTCRHSELVWQGNTCVRRTGGGSQPSATNGSSSSSSAAQQGAGGGGTQNGGASGVRQCQGDQNMCNPNAQSVPNTSRCCCGDGVCDGPEQAAPADCPSDCS